MLQKTNFTDNMIEKPVLVWDVGGVILKWDPIQFADVYQNGLYKKECLAIFTKDNWKKFDKGLLSYNDLLTIFSKQFQLPTHTIDAILQAAFHSLQPVWPVINLIKQFKQLGYEQYCLTNGSQEYLDYVTSEGYRKDYKFSLFDIFDVKHIVLSTSLKLAKPQIEIFQHTEALYGLQKRKIIFIDDSEINIDGARAAGWEGIHFTTLEDCIEELKKLSINVVID